MSKKIFYVFALIAAMQISWRSFAATEVVDGIEWTYAVEDGAASVICIPSSTTGAIAIPSLLGKYPVTSIGANAFGWNKGLTSVTIPDSVTNICDGAFVNCSGLTSVLIPSSVASIGIRAFYGCSGLTSVVLPERMTNIGDSAFYGCSGLMNVVLPESITDVGYSAFYNCNGITNVVLHTGSVRFSNVFSPCENITSVVLCEGITNICDWAFSHCSGLTSVKIPSSVTSIGSYAFYNCSGLESITIPPNTRSVGSSAFYGCGGLTNVTISEGVTTLGDSAFRDCSCLTNVELPASVINIGSSVFSDCLGLTNVELHTCSMQLSTAFGSCENITLVICEGVTNICDWAFSHCHGLTSVTIPSSVASIGSGAFYGCSNLKYITIPEGVRSIGGNAFYGCSGLTNVTIPSSIVSVGDSAFYGCSGLKQVTLCANLSRFSRIFYSCENLSNVIIDYGVTSIDDDMFYDCKGLMSVSIPSSVSSIGSYAFYNCSGLKSITLPEGLTSISGGAFSHCTGLTSITIPSSVTRIGSGENENAFEGCANLEAIYVHNANQSYMSVNGLLLEKDGSTLICGIKGNITIPDGVMRIGNEAFHGCDGLTHVTIPLSVTDIGEAAFEDCENLTEITIPRGVTNIGDRAFGYCYRLARLTMGKELKRIGDWAFEYCSSLTEVVIPDGVISIGRGAFSGCIELGNITIPSSVKSIGDYAFDGCEGLGDGVVIVDNCVLTVNGQCPSSVVLPEGTRLIAGGAFNCCERSEGCDELKSITLPTSLTGIGEYAFAYCTALTEITIPGSVVKIGDSAFSGCSGLTNVLISNGVVSIGGYSFDGCTGLTSIKIPSTVTSIGDDEIESGSAFSGCSNLMSIIVDAANPVYESLDGLVLNKDGRTLVFGINGDVTIPNGVTSIENNAFNELRQLTRVVLPSGVTNIGDDAFMHCSELTDLTLPEGLERIGEGAFYGCSGLAHITIPSSVTSIGYNAFGDCTGLGNGIIIVDDCVLTVNGECPNTVGLPEGTRLIAGGAFGGCGDLQDITMPHSVTSIGDWAFWDCYGLTQMVIPEGVTNIGNYAFCHCTGLTHITIPASVVALGDSAFYDCSGLAEINFEGPPPIGLRCASINENIAITYDVQYQEQWMMTVFECGFTNAKVKTYTAVCDGITWTYTISRGGASLGGGYSDRAVPISTTGAIEIPSILGGYTVTHICDNAFAPFVCDNQIKSFSGVTSITIPEGVKSIGVAFTGCAGLEEVTIPSSVTNINNGAFSYCPELTRINVNEGNTHYKSIDGLLLSKDGHLLIKGINAEVTIPQGVTHIGHGAFNGCYNLSSIIIPEGVTNIDEQAFTDCTGLTVVTIPPSVTSIGCIAFSGCSGLGNGVVIVNDCVLTVNNECPDNVILPEGTRLIAGGAFWDCYEVKSVQMPSIITVPSSVVNIGEAAFYDCNELTQIDFQGKPPEGLAEAYLSPDTFIRYNAFYEDKWIGAINQCGFLNTSPYDPWPAPTITPESGSVIDTTLTISISPVDGATIHYTIDGSEPTSESPIYSKKFRISKKTIVKAIAVYGNGNCSNVAVAEYAKGTCTDPVISPADGTTFTHSNQAVAIDWNEAEGVVRYTLDGSEPTEDSTVYSSPFAISETTAVKAKVFSDEYVNSQVVTAKLTREWLTVENPTISADTDFVGAENKVSIVCPTAGATIYYTTDGSTPTSSSKVYDDTFAVTNSCVVKAIALCDDMRDSGVASIAITLNWLPIDDVTVQAKSEFVGASTPVTLSCATEGAAIYYTLDGSEPSASSTLYGGVFDVTNSCTVRAFAVLSNEVYRGTSETSFAITRNWLPVAAPSISAKSSFTGSKTPVEISCATEGATIYYTTDGSAPSIQSPVYESVFNVTNSCTVRAISILSNDVYRGAVEVSFAIEKVWTIGDALNVPDMIFTTTGDAEWWRDTETTHDGMEAMRSGEIGDNQQTEIATTVEGVGVFSFWLKTSCEDSDGYYDYDRMEFYADDSMIPFDGQHDWTNVVCRLNTEGTHTFRWVYMKDNVEKGGDDCVWLDEIKWTAGKPIAQGKVCEITPDGFESPLAVSNDWLIAKGLAKEGDSIADVAAKMSSNGKNGIPRYQSYVLGMEPDSDVPAEEQLKVTISGFDKDGVPVISYEPTPNDATHVTVKKLGRKTLPTSDDMGWSEVNGNESDFNFFKVKVEVR